MQKLSAIEPLILPSELADVKFLPDDDFQILTLGTVTTQGLSSVAEYDLSGEWEMNQQMCTKSKLSSAMGIALYRSGDFAIANHNNDQVKVFNQDGTFKHNIDVKQDSKESQPWGLSLRGNNMYVTDLTPYVKVFDAKAKLIKTFQSVSPASPVCSKKSSLVGLTIDCEDQIIVGDYSNSYISIHKLCGTHLSSFNTNIGPAFIASAPSNNSAIVISEMSASKVQIMDYTGQVLHTLDKPTGVNIAWKPTGMCYNGSKELLIASQSQNKSGKKAGIHRYTTAGDYIGCITMEVKNPTDVAITRDRKILVLEWTSVKVFTKK